ncbi:MAG: hypothetical protein RIC87_08755 [Kiloniellales bacterium]
MAWRSTATALVLMALGSSAWAEMPLERAYFIGHWGIGDPQECQSRDTLSFYESGAWAVTNGGENPVEAIGLWQLEGSTVTIQASDLRSPQHYDVLEAPITEVTADSFVMTAEPLQDGKATLYRCTP